MFGKKPNAAEVKLDAVKHKILDELIEHAPDDADYPTLMSHLERVDSMQHTKMQRVSPDAVVQTVGAFLSVLVIVMYEQKHVLTSKSLSLLPKFK